VVTRLVLQVLALLGCCGVAGAHDFWIEPSTHRPAPGAVVAATLRIGDHGTTATYGRTPVHVERFVLTGRDGTIVVPGRPGDDPAGRVTVPAAGPWWLAYRSRRSFIALEAAAFEGYLRDEGLDRIVGLRRGAGLAARPGRETFSRCAKALLWSGEPTATPAALATITTPLGLTLELVPEADPSRLHFGDTLSVRLLFEDAPVVAALVDATWLAVPTRTVSLRTDAAGRVQIPLTHTGSWMLAAVHMEPAAPDVVPRADWESWWASLTFAVPEG
jgi:hypothetical protein